jgi:zinc/manganese transport system substrate-binding protein
VLPSARLVWLCAAIRDMGGGAIASAPSWATAAAVLVLSVACADATGAGSGSGDDAAGPVVAATTSIWADVVRNVACEGGVEVVEIIPVGGDAHSFEPSLQDRDDLGGAALVVANGLSLEAGLRDTLDAVRDEGTPVFEIGEHVEPLPSSANDDRHSDEGHDEHEDDDGHDHATDPHVWFDPARVAGVLPGLGDALVEAGLDAAAVRRCVAEYQRQLTDLDAELTTLLSAVPAQQRKLVTNHDFLGYFADRYGFEVVGTVIPTTSTLAQPNPGDLEELAQLIAQTGVPAIFTETQQSAADADALAERVGDVTVVGLYTETLGEPGSGADTYIGLLRTDAQRIAVALSGLQQNGD